MKRLDGKVTIVTGAGSGIGEATTRLMAREGALVAVADLRREQAERVAADLDAAVPVENGTQAALSTSSCSICDCWASAVRGSVGSSFVAFRT